jgi:hypothetical protein
MEYITKVDVTKLTNSVFNYKYDDTDLDLSKGLCVGSDDPDMWFAGEVDITDPNSSVNANSQATKLEVDKAIAALSICKNCPAKDDCLELGKHGQQLYFGIYGGTMAGERLAMMGRVTKNSLVKQKVSFAHKVRRTIKERGI